MNFKTVQELHNKYKWRSIDKFMPLAKRTYLLLRYRYTAASPSFAIARTSISAHDSTYRGSYEGRLNLYHRLGRGTFQCILFWGYLGIISL